MTEEVCKERHKTVDEKLADHENRLNIHGIKIEKLECSDSSLEQKVANLCDKMDKLGSNIKWGASVFAGAIGIGLSILGLILR